MSLHDGGKHIVTVGINSDKDGYIERECPECENTFKIKPSTGKFDSDNLFCPYCNHTASNQNFFTKTQVEYAYASIQRNFMSELKGAIRDVVNSSDCMSITKESDEQPLPNMTVSDKNYDSEITCAICSLQYAIDGTHECCPCCGTHV